MVSNSLRPTISAPVRSRFSVTWRVLASVIFSGMPPISVSTSPLPYHLNRCSKPVSSGPAM